MTGAQDFFKRLAWTASSVQKLSPVFGTDAQMLTGLAGQQELARFIQLCPGLFRTA